MSGAAFYHHFFADGQPGDINWKSSSEEELPFFCGCEAPGSQRCFVQQLASSGNEHVTDMQNYTLVTIDLLKCFRGKCPHKYGKIVMECVLIYLNLAVFGFVSLLSLLCKCCAPALVQVSPVSLSMTVLVC